MTKHMNGQRPEPPRLSDKDVEDIYRYATEIDTGIGDLRGKLAELFHDYRLAAFAANGGEAAALAQEAADEDAIPVEMPEDLQRLVDDSKAGIDTFRVVWHNYNIDDILRQSGRADRIADALWFCIGTVEGHLTRMQELIAAAIKAANDKEIAAEQRRTDPTPSA
jgi:hypothetical protein